MPMAIQQNITVPADKIYAAKRAIDEQSNILKLLTSYGMPENAVSISTKSYLNGMKKIMDMFGIPEDCIADIKPNCQNKIIAIKRG